MRKLFLLSIVIIMTIQLTAQQSFKKTTLYCELGGTGLGISLNYERQLWPKPGLGLHAGIGLAGNKPSIIVGAKYLVDLGNHKSFFETGAGVSLADREYVGAKQDTLTGRNPYTVAFIPAAGFRQHTKYGLMWRVNYTPVFTKYKSLVLYAGISVGWRF